MLSHAMALLWRVKDRLNPAHAADDERQPMRAISIIKGRKASPEHHVQVSCIAETRVKQHIVLSIGELISKQADNTASVLIILLLDDAWRKCISL